ncbi:MAG: ABC transporter substrate-binding protein [Candidatus Borkfalkiaceae bacterium]|nr:ABC transporter substrate-binding protein [Clostridia bacterium]MDY6223557.1 ABC transporter substrate-binding protein [Christensenellaceae bacterium]
MKNKRFYRALALTLCGALSVGTLSAFAGCKKKTRDAIVLMTEELSGLFNPFYATSGTDMDVVGMTQIGMLSTDSNGQPQAGEDLPTVVLDYEVKNGSAESVYTFVLKNGLKFSDGKPLTMNDVLFNMYEYLDPVYTGSSTMYSIKIKGLSAYRLQENSSAGGSETESTLNNSANAFALTRVMELVMTYQDAGLIENTTNSYQLTESQMRDAIAEREVSAGYKQAVATDKQRNELAAQGAAAENAFYRAQLLEDYEYALKTFKEELESDFKAAKESFDLTTAPYKDWESVLKDDVFKFLVYEGYIKPVYADDEKNPGKKDKTKIKEWDGEVGSSNTKEKAINRVYNDNVVNHLHEVLQSSATAGTLKTEFAAKAKEVLLRNTMGDSDSLLRPNIEGIVSLGHTTDVTEVTVNGTPYPVAQSHNADGTPADGKYDVLQITIEGTDPKAIYNFGFTVAPAHYYTADADHPNGREIDIANNKFGVEYATASFQSNVIQSQQHQEVPVGAGAYQATNEKNDDNPSGSEFWKSNVVYFKKNENFMFDVKTAKIQFQVVSPSNALDTLQSGAVDYVTPQFTKANVERLVNMKSSGFEKLESWQLGYGYIGINAGKVPNLNIRRAIMSAMEPSLATQYYSTGTCEVIDWPMSKMSWAYPLESNGSSKQNGHEYTQWTGVEQAKAKIQKYMSLAGVTSGDSQLKIRFTIAGASITEHPTYSVFKQAKELLNDLGWDVEVKADSQALTKLSTGSLEVWAAAWGSTVDPDMYQVYHKNSTATSVYAWGYREIKANTTKYEKEYEIINKMSKVIDQAREINDQNERKSLYETAMGYVLDLAVEMPVYQRKNLYAYNSKRVKGFKTEVNAFSSPLEKVWELELIQ